MKQKNTFNCLYLGVLKPGEVPYVLKNRQTLINTRACKKERNINSLSNEMVGAITIKARQSSEKNERKVKIRHQMDGMTI